MILISFIISFALCALCRNPQEVDRNVITNKYIYYVVQYFSQRDA